MKTLVIYENGPVEPNYYFGDIPADIRDALRIAHGLMINVDELTEEQDAAHEKASDWLQRSNLMISSRELSNVKPDQIFWLGFYC